MQSRGRRWAGPRQPFGADFRSLFRGQGEIDGALLPPDPGVQSARCTRKVVRASLATRQFFVRCVLLGSHVVRKERVPSALAQLLTRECCLAAGIEVDGVVATESGKSHGG